MVKNPHIKPRWEKRERKENCCIPMCSNVSFTLSKITCSEQISQMFQCETVPHPTPLCQQHYHIVYETLQPKSTHCCTCNSALRNTHKRTCPNPKEIQKYLVENTGFDGTCDVVFPHLQMLQQVTQRCWIARYRMMCRSSSTDGTSTPPTEAIWYPMSKTLMQGTGV